MDGQTATNPQTGEKVVLRNGQWVPMGPAQASPQARPMASQAQPSPQGNQPRGIRNNNPGNIEDGAFARSLPGYAGGDGRFARFDSPDAGMGAKTQLLGSYINRGFDTPAKIINRWAPPSDNNPTQAYAEYVARRTGVDVNQRVTPDQIPLIAAAISEFENGTQQQGMASPQQTAAAPMARQTATNPQTGEKMELVDGQWAPVVNQTAAAAPAQSPTGYNLPEGVVDYESLTPEAIGQLKRGARVLMPADAPGQPRQIVTLARDLSAPDRQAIMGEQRQTFGGVQTYTPGMADTVGAFASGAAEQIPFLDEAVRGADAALSGQSFGQATQDYRAMQQGLNSSDRGARNAGGVAGFAAGFALPGAGFVGRGANMAQRAGRAATVGAGYGSVYGAGATEGGLGDRMQGAAIGGALGLASGGLAQAGVDRFGQMAARAAANPSPARQLSREGVTLTPGQMAQSVPVVGPMLRGMEDGASGIPLIGSAVQGARNQGTESFNRVAINRALAPIGESLPRNATPGYESVEIAQRTLGNAYDEVLKDVTVQFDQPLYDDLGQILSNAAEAMPEPQVRQLTTILQQRMFRGLDESNATITGERFKKIEEDLGRLAREQARNSDGQALSNSIRETQEAIREMVARQNLPVADRIRAINTGYANLTRVERAAGSIGALGTEGVFTPSQLGNASLFMGGSRSSRARGGNLMQDLAKAGKSVLPNTVGDSGTATRGAITALVGGLGAGAVSPGLAVPVVAASLAYSRPAQAALNLIYRSTDRPGAVSEGLSQLANLARRNPALVPFYEAALLRSSLSSRSEGQGQRPEARGLFGARRPQTVPQ